MLVSLWEIQRRYVDPVARVWALHGLMTGLAKAYVNGTISDSQGIMATVELMDPANQERFPEFKEVYERMVNGVVYV